ncbi:MAG: hypothetical protein AAGA23_22360 [Pseudomonadota bacterium]
MADARLKPGEGLKILLRTVGAERAAAKLADAHASALIKLLDRAGRGLDAAPAGSRREADDHPEASPTGHDAGATPSRG